jgi:DNA-binding transcriptional LysR family regulator
MLLEDDLVCVFDKRSAPGPAFSLQAFAERRHVFPTPWTSDHQHGRRLAGTPGPQAPVVARANSYSAALKMITGTDFIITLPRRVKTAGAGSAVRLLRGAQRVAGFTLDMQWNETSEQDSANIWFASRW